MFKVVKNHMKSLIAYVSAVLLNLFVVSQCFATDYFSSGKTNIQDSIGVGSTLYFTVFGVGLLGTIVKAKQSGDWVKWLSGYGACLLGYSILISFV